MSDLAFVLSGEAAARRAFKRRTFTAALFVTSALVSTPAAHAANPFPDVDESNRSSVETQTQRAAETISARRLPAEASESSARGYFTLIDPVPHAPGDRVYWDGGNVAGHNNNVINGGDGIWSLTSPNFTDELGAVNGPMSPTPSTAIFSGAAGTVTIDNSAGQVTASGLEFLTSGYRLIGSPLNLGSNQAIIRVGDGTAAGANHVATISADLIGTGGFNKTDLGTLIFTGSTSALTTISAGTLQLGDASFNGFLNGNVVNNATLRFSQPNSYTFSNSISGSGSVIKTGNADLFVTGSLTHTGGTTISNGRVFIGRGGTSGSISGDIVNNASLIFGRSDQFIYGGNISGSGEMTQDGPGTLILTGDVSLASQTEVNTGRLQIGNGGTTGSMTGGIRLINNGSVLFNRSDAYTYAGAIAGTGNVTNLGSGTLTFGGPIQSQGQIANTGSGTMIIAGSLSSLGTGTLVQSGTGTMLLTSFVNAAAGITVSAGTLRIGDGGTSGEIPFDNILNNSAVIFNRSNSSDFRGSMTGSGTVEKLGGGTLIVHGTLSNTGGVTVSGGTLQIGDGTNNGAVLGDIVNNATLAFNRNPGFTHAGNISGTGSIRLTVNGTPSNSTAVFTGDVSAALTTIVRGNLQIGDGGTTGSIAGNIVAEGGFGQSGITFNRAGTLTYGGNMTGNFQLTKAGAGTLILTGSVTPGVATSVISAGTLQIGNGGTIGSISGNISNSGTLIFNRSDLATYAGTLSGSGALIQAGTGTLVLTGSATQHTGTTLISSGTLQIGNNSAAGFNGSVTNNGSLVFFRPGAFLYGGNVSGSGDVTFMAGQTTVTGLINVAGPVTISGATLRIGNGTLGSVDSNIVNNGTLVFSRSDNLAYGRNITGTGAIFKQGAGTLTLTGTVGGTGLFTVSNGIVQVGDGVTSGTISNNVALSTAAAALNFNRSDSVSYAGTLSGTGTVAQIGAGSLALTGDSSAFAGVTNAAAGSLIVTGMLGASAHRLNIASGARLAGTGRIGGLTTIADGGTLVGMQGATLSFGDLTLNNASNINVALGAPGTQALFDVSGNLTLDGVLNITDASGFGPGLYRLFDYGGTLTDNGLNIGTIPAGVSASDLSIQTSIANQVNLVRSAGIELVFWDGGNAAQWDNGTIDGGSGTWTATSRTWTDTTGATNGAMRPLPGFAIFAGAAGTVNADTSAGALAVLGMQFATTGYVINGGPIALAGAGGMSTIRVGDGTAASASHVATINAALTGNSGLTKTDLGTLILSGNNLYTGTTTISSGRLQVGAGGTTGSLTGPVLNNGVLEFNRSDALTYAQAISGSGITRNIGAGTLTLSGGLSGAGVFQNVNGTTIISGAATHSGGTTISAGTLRIGAGGTSGSVAGDIVNNAALVFDRSDNLLHAGNVSGTGTVQKLGAGTLTVTGDIASSGIVTVSAGTLQIGNGGTTGSVAGDIVNNGTVAFNRSVATSHTGLISGTGGLVQAGTGALTLLRDLTYTGGTTIAAGARLNLGNGGTGGAIVGDVLNDGVLTVNRSVSTTLAGRISGSGSLVKQNASTLILTGDSTYTGGTFVALGTLQIGDGGTTGSVVGNIDNDGALIFNRANSYLFAGDISGIGTVTHAGTGLLTLTGDVTSTGLFTANGAVQIGNGGTTGSIERNILNNGGVTFNRSDSLFYDGVMTGAGALTKLGAGTLTLTGNSALYAGTASINAGSLHITGTFGSSTSRLNIQSGARLSGTGQIGGLTTIADGGILVGAQGSTLTFGGLNLSGGSIINATLGAPGSQALFNVTGNLTLDGVLNVADMGGFGPGLYRLFSYGGTLTNNGLTIGTFPAGSDPGALSIQTAVANQVNLVNASGLDLLFWDGGNAALHSNGAVDGGTGTWTATSPTWTTANGAVNGAIRPAPGFAIFSGTAGTVTVDNGAGAVSALGMQFATGGYVLNGGPITLAGAGGDSIIRVGDGTGVGASATATINAALTGATRLVKTDLGTLILAGANTYTGNTLVSGGTLQIGNGGTSGTLAGLVDVANGATLAFNRADAVTYAGVISGGGALVQGGAGTLTLTGDSTYAGGTTISAGTLQIGNGGTTGNIVGNVTDNGALIFNRSNDYVFAGNISGAGSVTHAGIGRLTLTGATSVGGLFTANGALQIGDGGTTGSIGGNIANNASVTFARSDSLTYAGNMSGTGSVTKLGAGTLTLTGANSYSGATSINAGILQIGAGGTTGSILGDILVNTTLRFNRSDALTYAGVLTGAGVLNQAGGGVLTLTGNSSGFAGTTNVAAGTLRVNGMLGTGASSVNVASAAALGGSGTIGGTVTIADGGRLVGLFGNTLTMGSLSLSSGSLIDVTLGSPSSQALFAVNGNLTLDGTLNVADGGGMGPGLYRLFNYSGVLTNNGLDIGSLPGGYVAGDITIQTSVANQVNLLNTRNVVLNFWDGGAAGNRNNGVIDGGAGTWTGTSLTWTDATGLTNGALRPTPGFAIFAGASGIVTASGTPQELSVTGMQFATDGYELRGDAVTLAGDGGQSIIRVGDGTAAGANMTATISAVLTGNSSLVKSDLGNLILTGANTYTGNTIVQAGTLTGNAASIRGNVSNAGTVVFNQGTNATFAGTTSGSGGFVKTGAGILTLTGASSSAWSVNQGELISTSQLFTGNLNIASGAAFSFNQSANGQYAGTLTGAGAFRVLGGGTVTLTGNSTGYTGTTTVNAGTLNVNGTLAGQLNIGAGGRLMGTGTVGTTSLSGTIAPGNSIGTLTINGNFTFGAGAVYEVEVNPQGQSDRIVVTGTASIGGGSVVSLASGGTYAPLTDYVILTAAGGVTGTFGSVTSNLAFLSPTLSYAANSVTLRLTRNDIDFSAAAATANQAAVANAVEAQGFGQTLYNRVLVLSTADSQAAFAQLAADGHASVQSSVMEDSRFLRDAFLDRGTVEGDGTAAWGRLLGSRGSTDSDGNATGYDRDAAGAAMGFDTSLGASWRLGIGVGYLDSDLDTDGGFGAKVETLQIGGYLTGRLGRFTLGLGGSYGAHDVTTSRTVIFPGFTEAASGAYDLTSLQVYGEVGFRLIEGRTNVQPFAQIAHVSVSSDAFVETGDSAALRSGDADSDATIGTLGLRADTRLGGEEAGISLVGMAGVRQLLSGGEPASAFSFDTGAPFTVSGNRLDETVFVGEAGIDINLSQRARIGISYSGRIGERVEDHGARATLSLRF